MSVRKSLEVVDYQDGAVVSSTLVKKETGSVTVFAFDKGQELSEHTVPHDALVHVLEGEVEIRIAGEPHRLGAGDLLLMPGGKPHAVKAIQRFKMVLTMIRS
jgi:quercetin dioxygenase-like cupin family protein